MRSQSFVDIVPIIERGTLPANGKYYTWEDDALNKAMRKEETYIPGPTSPGRNSAGRCKGFSRAHMRPCRKWSRKNAEGRYLAFCGEHLQTTSVWGTGGGQLVSSSAIVARTQKHTRHGAYSEILRLQIIEGLKANSDPRSKATLNNILGVMTEVDTDDLSGPLNGAMQLTMGVTAALVQKFAAGEIGFGDFLTGSTILAEQLRKLAATKHEIVGTADDEKERAIQQALEDQGLLGEVSDVNVFSEDEGVWEAVTSGDERGSESQDFVGSGDISEGSWGKNDSTGLSLDS
jgi:hypothetical protein